MSSNPFTDPTFPAPVPTGAPISVPRQAEAAAEPEAAGGGEEVPQTYADLHPARWKNLDWPVIGGIIALHLGCVAAFFPAFFSWSGLALAAVLYWLTGGLGVTLGYHRLLTHRSFKTFKSVEYMLTGLACLAWQGGPVQWVGTHRLHHKHADEEDDPHSPTHGFTWSHMFWTLMKEPEGMPAESAAKDLLRDRGQRFLNRYFWVPQALLAATLFGIGYLVGGWWLAGSWVVWAIGVRTVVCYHATWFVNSASHTWGYRNYAEDNHSTNLWWVALLSWGEGWHNNHHAQQRSAAHGQRWFEVDPTYWTIKLMQALGLAWNVVPPQPEKMNAHH